LATDRPIRRLWYTLTTNAAAIAASRAKDNEIALALW
jgi:hypothetical protein